MNYIGKKFFSDQKIVRYMDLAKFLDLIGNNLFFTRVDKLQDRYEMMPLYQDYFPFLRKIIRDPYIKEKYDINSGNDPDINDRNILTLLEEYRHQTFVNCWSVFENESNALWKLYTNSGKGVAIVSTIKDVYYAIVDSNIRDHMKCGEIRYIDWKKDSIIDEYNDGELNLEYYKRKFFSYENEFRFSISIFPQEKTFPDGEEPISISQSFSNPGVSYHANSAMIIDKVIISPYFNVDISFKIRNLLENHNIIADVVSSDML